MKTYLVLVMILLIVLIGCSFYSYQSFKSNTKNAQVALLNQVQHEMDIRLENISKISQLLADHPIMGFSLLSEMEFFAVPKNGISLNI